MNDADELVSKWALEKFKKRALHQYDYYNDHAFKMGQPKWWQQMVQDRHIALCPSARFEALQHGWYCGCYSSYTRDDEWYVEGTIKCDHHDTVYRISAREYDEGLPGMIKELIQTDEQDCVYESDEYNS